MKVESGIQDEDNDRGGWFFIKVNGKQRLFIGGGEPEDMMLGRDLSDVFGVPDLMKEAHAAGVRGEPLEMVEL